MSGSRLEILGRGIHVEINRLHTFGEDALALAAFSLPETGERVCELGCGCGVISLIWCRDASPACVDAVEIQPEAAEMAARSVMSSGLSEIIHVHCADLRLWRPDVPASYDMVAMNPPYFESGSGKVSENRAIRIARHESDDSCRFREVAEASARLLRPGGRFCFCHRPERLDALTEELRETGLEPKRMLPVFAQHIDEHAAGMPRLILCEARLC